MQKLEQKMLALADQCVKCGMCLPSCPTNNLTGLEGHSPRGRVALWQKIAAKQLTPSEQTLNYLNGCLGCGACENNCPAGVKFLELQNLGKNHLLNNNLANPASPKQFFNQLVIKILSSKHLNKIAAYSLYLYQRLSFKFIPLLNSLARINLPISLLRPGIEIHQSSSTHSNEINVLLFIGCANKLIALSTVKSIISVLNKLNINVITHDDLTCCAALYTHAGVVNTAGKIIQHNQGRLTTLLKSHPISHILTMDTGCHQQIVQQFASFNQSPNDHDFVLNIQDYIYKLLQSKPSKIIEKVSPAIYVYNPCSQREQLKSTDITQNLLKLALPGASVNTISKGFGCCGAAGRYMLDHPQMAEKLAVEILESLVKNSSLSDNTIICTSNSGCAMHLQNILLKKYRVKTEIKHPLTIISEYSQ